MIQSTCALHPRRGSDAAHERRAPLRGWERGIACAAGAYTGAGTVAWWAEYALGPAVARVRDALAAGAPLDAEGARTLTSLLALAERFEFLASYPAWAVGLAVVALIGGVCALAACLIRRGGRTAWFATSLAVPLALAWTGWPSWA